MFQVLILNTMPERPNSVIYEGHSKSVLLPGTEGEFEILDFHKTILSRLKKGIIVVDNEKEIAIKGGVMSMSKQQLVAMVDV